ncbi:hypothetical protein J2X69_000932 [Algoriphagus sp. 4150]|nr:hypothetical protein [Algoriphagus sp. 4150]
MAAPELWKAAFIVRKKLFSCVYNCFSMVTPNSRGRLWNLACRIIIPLPNQVRDKLCVVLDMLDFMFFSVNSNYKYSVLLIIEKSQEAFFVFFILSLYRSIGKQAVTARKLEWKLSKIQLRL